MAPALTEHQALALAQRLVHRAVEVLTDTGPVSAILHGSLVTSDYVPGRSDVDLLLVVERGLTHAEAGGLVEVVRALVDPEVDLDLRVVTRAAAASPTPAPAVELYVGRHGGGPDEIEARSPGEPDLVVEFWVARHGGRSLHGPDPTEVVGPVPAVWIVEYGHRLLAGWQRLTDDDRHAELMVLTACRIWRFAETAEMVSKSAAARWALERDPSLSAIPAVLRRRGGENRAPVPPRGIAAVLAAAKRATSGALGAS